MTTSRRRLLVSLTTRSSGDLEQLAAVRGISRSQLINDLIREEQARQLVLPLDHAETHKPEGDDAIPARRSRHARQRRDELTGTAEAEHAQSRPHSAKKKAAPRSRHRSAAHPTAT